MKFPNWFKIAWWSVLSISIAVILFDRLVAIRSGTATGIDATLLVIFLILLLLPLFQEFDLFGIKLKSKIDEVKTEVKDQVTSLRREILNIGISTQFNPQINLSPPSDSSLPGLEEKFRKILNETLKEHKIQQPVDIQTELLIPNDVNYLFIVRYNIEKELRRIWKERFEGGDERKPEPIFRIVQALRENELLDPRLGSGIREVYSACSPAIHGEEVSDRQVLFVKDLAPELITALMRIK